MLHREQGRRGPAGHADLGVDVRHVVLGRAPGDDQALGDLGVAAPSATSPSTSTSRALSPAGSAGRAGWRGTTGAWPAAASTAPAASGSRAPERASASSRRCASSGASSRGPVRPGLGHRLVGVGGGQLARAGTESSARGAATVVAAAVEALVVHPHHGRQRPQPLRPGQDPLGVVGVQPDLLPLVPVPGGPASPRPRRDGHPADVVQQPGHLEVGHGLRRQPQPLPGAAGRGRPRRASARG